MRWRKYQYTKTVTFLCCSLESYSQPCLNGTCCVGTNHKLERNAVQRSGGHSILEYRFNFATWNEVWAKFRYENMCSVK